VRLLVAFASRFTPRTGDIGIDGTVLLFAVLLSLLTGLLFGTIPALQISRQNLAVALREGSGKATAGAAKHRFRNLMVVAQVAVSFVLLVAAGLTVRSFLKLQQVDTGFDPENVLTVELSLPFSKYTNPTQMLGFYQPLLERLGNRPGVVSAAMASDIPLRGDLFSPSIRIEGRQPDPRQPEPTATFHIASPDYFRTLGIALRRGRAFTGSDRAGAPPAVIVNESLARLHWPGQDAVGKRMEVPMFGGGLRTVVGVVADVKQHGLDMEAGPSFYLPFLEFPGDGRLLLRTTDPAGLAREVRAAVHQLDPEVPVADVRTLAQVRSEWLAPSRLTALLLSLLAGLAFVITALGISGVVAFSVAERTQEIGIRSVLGAARGDLVGMVLRQGLALVLAGVVLGAFGAFYLSRLVSSLLFGVEPTDPLTFAAVSMALLLIVTVACFIPARRATSIDPLQALRY
jgi:predicted permease